MTGKTPETCPHCGQMCTYRRRLRRQVFILLRPSSSNLVVCRAKTVPLFPIIPASLGFGGSPLFAGFCVPNEAKYALYSAVVSTPYLGRKAAHRRSQGETRGDFMRSVRYQVRHTQHLIFRLSCVPSEHPRCIPTPPFVVRDTGQRPVESAGCDNEGSHCVCGHPA